MTSRPASRRIFNSQALLRLFGTPRPAQPLELLGDRAALKLRRRPPRLETYTLAVEHERLAAVRGLVGREDGYSWQVEIGYKLGYNCHETKAPDCVSAGQRLGTPSGTRTPNPLIKSQLLCQLS